MKNLNITRKTLLGVALLGSFVAAPFVTPMAQAAPKDGAPAYGRRAKDKNDRRNDRRRDNRRDDDRDNRDRNRDDNRYDRNRYDNDSTYRNNYDRNASNNSSNATYTGTVTNVRAGNSFDLSANGRTYNVYTSSGVPRGLSEGDAVRVYGRPYGDNDIRNASVSITSNTRDNTGRDARTGNRYNPNDKRGGYNNGTYNNGGYNNGNVGGYQNYSGTVTDVKSDREFNVRVGGTTYNVYANAATRGLNRGDQVRVYGQPYGVNDIRNARATVTRNTNGDNGSLGRYETFTGTVTDVSNDREFNVRIGGTTYNVYAASSTRGLSNGDIVRIYGQRYGVNDIRNANATITRNR